MHIHEDVGIRRLLQSIKTGLRSGSYAGTKIFGRYYPAEELIALILRHVRERAEYLQLGQPVQGALIGRPVTFAHDPAVDQLAEEKLRRGAPGRLCGGGLPAGAGRRRRFLCQACAARADDSEFLILGEAPWISPFWK